MSRPVVIVPGGIGGTGGLSIDVRNLANGLAARGRRVVVAGADARDPALGSLVGATAVRLRSRGPAPLAARFGVQTGLARVLREQPDAIVHVFGSMPSYLTFTALTIARLRGHPIVWTPMFHPLRTRLWRRRPLLRPMLLFDRLLPGAARLVDAVGAATDAEAAAFTRRARRVEMLPPVVEPAAVLPAAEASAFRAATGIDSSPLVVLVASRDEPRKGLDFGLAAFARLRTREPAARLLLVGPADVPPSRLPEGARSAGWVDDETLRRALRAADVVLVPSLFEAFSRVVIEAWQQETPVVVSDGVALATLVRQAGGRPVPYGDVGAAAAELERLLRDRKAAREEGSAGALLVRERFLVDVLLRSVEELYGELPAGKATEAAERRTARAA